MALAAGDVIDVPVGFDPDLECATFDSDSLELDDLKGAVQVALADLDPDWETHLRIVDD